MYISGAPGCGKTALLRELHTHFVQVEQEKVQKQRKEPVSLFLTL
jgi:predicted ATPase